MTARQDTIERIERCLELTSKKSITVTIPRLTAERAVSMLKEQEPVAPGLEQDADGIYSTCRNCRTRLWEIIPGVEFSIPDAMPKFCPQCGQAVDLK